MQILKDDIKDRILKYARKEFLAKGYKNATIRNIADSSGIAAGNIYKYFKSKDELFCAILQPVITALDHFIKSHNEERHLNIDIFEIDEFQLEYINSMLDLIKQYRLELRLLLFNAEDTSLHNYKDTLVNEQVRIGTEFLRLLKERYPYIKTNVSHLFMRITCTAWVNVFSEIVANDTYSDQEIKQALKEYAVYGTAGWKELTTIKNI